ncbi:substrate-binding domain-containing protein [Nocardioides sp.]|uniref:substrate-binding domain-containing protein n=1 Tax=Nocardioides sp. TaxID=35761 RepID=UPI002B26A076|nr:substrate-binding domain-containing protein [Nocardioides sp.]
MSTPLHRFAVAGAAVLIGAAGLSACGANDAQSGSGADNSDGTSSDSLSIALLLPESKTTRYEAFDKPLFEAKVAELCEECVVDYYNADQDEAKQQTQVAAALTKGAKVLVLDPVNGDGAGGMVADAQAEGVPVIAYDRFIAGADYYMSFDNNTVGNMQGEALVGAMDDSGDILMLNGAPSDPNAGQFKAGAHEVIDASGLEILGEYDNPDWSPENAQSYVTDQVTKFGAENIDGVYAANDGQAGGVVAALLGAGVKAADLPPITGQDAELAAVQRIVAGEQTVTIYKPIPIEAETAAELAVDIARGNDIPDTSVTGVEQSDFEGVTSYIFSPTAVTQDNVLDTVIADGFYAVADICTAAYADACKAAGIQ